MTDIDEAWVIYFLGVQTDRILETSYGNIKFNFKNTLFMTIFGFLVYFFLN